MSIKIVFHGHYYNCQYAIDPAAAEGRLNGIMEIIESRPELYEIVEPIPASKADILRAHGKRMHSVPSRAIKV